MRTPRHQARLRRWIVASPALVVLLSAAVGHAAVTAATCASAKQKLAGKSAAAKLACYAKATKAGAAVDPECLSKVAAKLADGFAKIEMKGACVTPGFPAALASMVDSFIADMVSATPPNGVAGCASAKQKLAGKTAASELGCYAKATKAGAAVDASCLEKVSDKLAAAYAKEEAKASGCAAFGAVASIDLRIEAFVARVLGATPVVEPAVRCCASTAFDGCADLTTANQSQCTGLYTGSLAGAGLVCDGGSGGCVEARTATVTGCCDGLPTAPGFCAEGPDAAAFCALGSGTFHAGEKCLSTGACGVADDPGATGPWNVGHRKLASVDPSRTNGRRCLGGTKDGRACTADSQCPSGTCSVGRSLPLDVWYPVDPADAFGPFTGYSLSGIATLNSDLAHEGAPVSSAGGRPLVIFSHGSGGIAIQSVHLMEQLASHGFVVVAPSHTGNTQADSTAVPPTSVSNAQALLDRVPDVTFVIDHMLALDGTIGDPFEGRIDETKIGVAGHSFGGFTALAVKGGYQGIPPDARVGAIMPIAPSASTMSDAELGNVAVPTLFMTGTSDPLLAEEVRDAGLVQASPANYRADVIGAVHTHFANICDIANVLIAAGFQPSSWSMIGAGALIAPYNDTCIPPAFPIAEATRLQNLYATAFFRRHLLGETAYGPYLTTAYAQANEPAIDFIVTP